MFKKQLASHSSWL